MKTVVVKEQYSEVSIVDALWTIIGEQTDSVKKALMDRMLSSDMELQSQQEMLSKSLNQAFSELQAGEVKHNARNLFS